MPQHRSRLRDRRNLVVRLRNGDDDAWGELYDELAGSIGGYARSKGIRDPDDLVGDVFAAAAERIGDFEGDESKLRSWLFTIAHHRLADTHRRLERRATDATGPQRFEHIEADRDAIDAAVERLDAEGALTLLDELTDDQREVLVLRVLGELSVSETAAVLDRTEGGVKALQHRAVSRLQRAVRREPYPFGARDDDSDDL